jgi:hypothetical protein
MRSSGDENRNDNMKRASGKPRGEQPPIFHPSVYRYTCTGALFLSSESTGSEGICRGIKSRLELLSDLQISTRDGAIRDFTEMNEYVLDGDSADSLDQKTKSILVSPALIYKDNTAEGKKDVLPEEELIKRQEWSCYGKTEVEYLVLKDPKSGNERISALTPRNNGLSIRRIEADSGSITNIMVGWLSIVLDTSFFQDSPTPEINNNNNDNSKRSLEERPPVEAMTPSSAPQETFDLARYAAGKMWAVSLKVVDAMQGNAVWLSQQVQDDFPQRTATAGNKIIGNLGPTVDKTFKYMGKLSNQLWRRGNGDDEDDDDS